MAINSGTALGGMSVSIQAKTVDAMPSLTSTLSQSNNVYKSYMITDSYQASTVNYQDIYQNPDLETILVERGFSQLRPEIIGCFEFIPPVTEEIKAAMGALTQETYSSASAEMFDLQCQLKQLRYAEVLEFFNIMLDLPTKSFGAGVTLDEESEGASYLEPFAAEMETAKEILDFLTIAYNSITAVLRAMDVKNNDYTSKETNSSASSIYDNLDIFDSDNIVVAPSNFTLKEYLIGQNIALDLPDVWWDTSTPTSIVCQLVMDAVLRLFHPIKSWTIDIQAAGGSWESRNPGKTFEKGTVLGVDFPESMAGATQTLDTNVSQLSNLTYSSVNISQSSSSGGTSFSKGDFEDMFESLFNNSHSIESSMQKYGDLLYLVASDWMAGCALRSGNNVMNTLKLKSSDSVEKTLEKIFGVETETLNIADVDPNTDSDSMVMKILPKDKDRSSSSPGKISSFQYSSQELASGAYSLRTGKSYYLDEVVTAEITDVIDRLNELDGGLSTLVSNLTLLGKKMKCPNVSSTYAMPGVSDNRGLASYLLHKMWLETKDDFVGSLNAISGEGSSSYREHVKIAILAMASEDIDLAWYLFNYIIYKSVYKQTDNETYKTLALQTAQTLSQHVIDNNRGIYGEEQTVSGVWYEYGGREELRFGYGDESLSTNDAGVSAVYTALEASDPGSMTAEEIYDVFDTDINTTLGIISSGYSAATAFSSMLKNAYSSGKMSSTDAVTGTSPRFNIDMLGVIAVLFFFQLHTWTNGLSWRQIPGESKRRSDV